MKSFIGSQIACGYFLGSSPYFSKHRIALHDYSINIKINGVRMYVFWN